MTKPASLVHGVPDTSSSKGDPNDAPPLQPGVQPKQPAREDNDDISTAAEVADADDVVELDLADDTKTQPEPAPARRTIRGRINWKRVLAYGVLPGLVLIIGGAVGYLTYQDRSAHASQLARSQSVQTASEATAAMLSYQPDSVDKDLAAAGDRLTGAFRDSYSKLVHDVVIPGAKQKQITAKATVPAAASVSANENHAVVLLFVNQTINVGADPPTDTASSVRVTLDKIGGHWLISQFDPI
jgi:Mce-associated membrane protein